ncbi:MAG: nuclear transport factor 2 family protein [Cyclobacteriaceae bacterium]|nr:MAG: nuclear transport factor 2 family protein [Cyclobacteriaceae bacterium]
MKKLIYLCLVGLTTTVFAQTPQQEINEQVWKPFTKAIMNQDVATFASLHSTDLVRAERNSGKILDLTEYQKNMEAGWPGWKESLAKNKIDYTFELRFTERISNGNLAYEVGYFKNESVSATGEKRIGYGQFHVTLRKENGIWKILVDSDSNLGGTITEEMFQAAKPLE